MNIFHIDPIKIMHYLTDIKNFTSKYEEIQRKTRELKFCNFVKTKRKNSLRISDIISILLCSIICDQQLSLKVNLSLRPYFWSQKTKWFQIIISWNSTLIISNKLDQNYFVWNFWTCFNTEAIIFNIHIFIGDILSNMK